MAQLINLDAFATAGMTRGFYVHLLSGAVEMVTPADRVQLDATSLKLMDGEQIAASYEREKVEYCSRENIDIPYL